MAKKLFYKLGGNASNFFDPTQSRSEYQKLLPNEVKDLDATPNVARAKQAGGIIQLSEDEAKEELARNQELKERIKKHDEAGKTLSKAASKEAEADAKLAEANAKLAEAKALHKENDELKSLNAKLESELKKNPKG